MKLNLFSKQTNAVSEIKNPFTKECICEITIFIRPKSDYKKFWAIIEFVNHNTKGRQDVEAENYESLMIKIQALIGSL